MAKKSKFELITPDEDDLAFFSKQYVNLGELNSEIEKLEENVPKDKRTQEYAKWKEKINFLIDTYNKLAHFKTFKKYE